jgi:hypothetical protein
MRADNRRHVSPISVYLKYWTIGKSEQLSFCQLWGLRVSFSCPPKETEEKLTPVKRYIVYAIIFKHQMAI